MEETLLKDRNQWAETLPDYDDGKIENKISNRRYLAWIAIILGVIGMGMSVILPRLQGT